MNIHIEWRGGFRPTLPEGTVDLTGLVTVAFAWAYLLAFAVCGGLLVSFGWNQLANSFLAIPAYLAGCALLVMAAVHAIFISALIGSERLVWGWLHFVALFASGFAVLWQILA